jgi:hypothetical protein
MVVRLEHANLIVRDINGMIRFLQTAFPEFRVRGEGKSRDGSRWVHVAGGSGVGTLPLELLPPLPYAVFISPPAGSMLLHVVTC